jgi:hypothetical protein
MLACQNNPTIWESLSSAQRQELAQLLAHLAVKFLLNQALGLHQEASHGLSCHDHL